MIVKNIVNYSILFLLFVIVFVFYKLKISEFKYDLIVFGIICSFLAELIGDDNKGSKIWDFFGKQFSKRYLMWAILKCLGAIALLFGVFITINDDQENNRRLKSQFSIIRMHSYEDSIRAYNTELRLNKVFDNISDFQERQFNPLPDSCYFMFDLIIDYSNLDIKNKIIKKRLVKVEGSDSLFSFDFPSKNDILSRYIEATNHSVILTFENKKSKIKYYTQYGYSPQVESRYCNQKNEIVFRYNLVSVYGFTGEYDYLDLKMIKASSTNFISTLDFENCKVKMCFGTLSYDKVLNKVGYLNVRIDKAKVLLDANGVDFIEVKNIKHYNNEALNFIGETDKLTINTLKNDCLSPLYYPNQERRGRN